jgi:mitogen-activated protein kinase kinase 1
MPSLDIDRNGIKQSYFSNKLKQPGGYKGKITASDLETVDCVCHGKTTV